MHPPGGDRRGGDTERLARDAAAGRGRGLSGDERSSAAQHLADQPLGGIERRGLGAATVVFVTLPGAKGAVVLRRAPAVDQEVAAVVVAERPQLGAEIGRVLAEEPRPVPGA